MKKRIIITLGMVLALCLAFTTAVMATQATKQSDITYRSIKIVVNGTEIAPVDVNGDSTEPFILNSEGSTYLPVRAIGDALGLSVDWNDDTSTVILESNGTEKFSSKKPSATNATKKAALTYRDIKITLDGSKVKLVNAKGDTVEPFIYNNSTYLPLRAVATALGCTITWDDDTSTVTITKQKTPEASKLNIKTQPKATAIAVNKTGTISIEVSGGTEPYSFEWQHDSGTYWGKEAQWWTEESGDIGIVITSSGSRSTISVTPNSAGYYLYSYPLRCVVTDASGNKVTSEQIQITNPDLNIKTQPKAAAIAVNKTGTVSIEVRGGTAPYTFEWQYDGGTYWGKEAQWFTQKSGELGVTITSSGGKSAVSVTPMSAGYYLYSYPLRCIVTDVNGNKVTSEQIQITNPELNIKTQPKAAAIAINKTGTVSIEVRGGTAPYTFEWQYDGGTYWGKEAQWFTQESGKSGVTITSSGGKSAVSVTPNSAGYYLYAYPLRCIVTDANGNKVTSEQIQITNPDLVIKTQPKAAAIAVNKTGTVSIEVSGGTAPYTFEWQYDGGTYWGKEAKWFTQKSGESGVTITSSGGKSTVSVTPSSEGYYLYSYPLRCIVTDANGNKVTSEQIQITKN